MRSAKDFFRPKAIGAPMPPREIPLRPSRMIHFFDPSNPRMAAKLPDLAKKCDVLLGNLEDAIQATNKVAAREGLVKIGRATDFGDSQLWTRVNSLDSPWMLDDITTLVGEIGDKLDVIMIPKVEGPWDIHYVDRLLAQLEAKARPARPILVHAILETRLGVTNVEEICAASPRMQGISLRPGGSRGRRAHEDDARRRRPPAVSGAHRPGPRAPRSAARDGAAGSVALHDGAHGGRLHRQRHPTLTTAPSATSRTRSACEDQFRAAFLLGCVGAWSLHPVQIEIARKVFSPPVDEVLWAKRVIAEMGDGSGCVMIDGKMQDDATVKQCRVMVAAAKLLAKKDPELRAAYQFSEADLVG